ncbi:MAG: DUF1194 domain-containing protein [Geminicoccaceae bacterium]
MRAACAILGAGLLLPAGMAQAAGLPVDLALVLLTDVSQSVDALRYTIQKEGYRTAFHDPDVIAAILDGGERRIAVAYAEFSGDAQARLVVGWTVIDSAAHAAAFGDAVAAAGRPEPGNTSIAAGLDLATDLLLRCGCDPQRRVVDVSGDGPNNTELSVTAARDRALSLGVTINGLAIVKGPGTPAALAAEAFYKFPHPPYNGFDLADYYRRNVIGGPEAFLVEAHGIDSFGAALRRKLLVEIAGL